MHPQKYNLKICQHLSSKLFPAAHFTRLKSQKLRIRDELRFLYIRKQRLNVKKKGQWKFTPHITVKL